MGNKCDLQDGRKVEMSAAQDYADSIDSLFFETSALKNTGTKYEPRCKKTGLRVSDQV